MFHWVLAMTLTCLKKDKNCEKPVRSLLVESSVSVQHTYL